MSHTAQFVLLATLIIAAIVAVIVIAASVHRSRGTRAHFGSEYSRILEEASGHPEPETAPVDPERHGKRFPVRPLGVSDRGRYADAWRAIQIESMDEPGRAVAHADLLLSQVMSARGYPMDEFERRSEEIAVDHPTIVRNYWKGHDVAVRQEVSEPGDLRLALAAYQSLIDELVGEVALTERVSSGMQRPARSR